MGEIRYRTTSDSTGWYRIEMPVGSYRIEVDPIGGVTYPVRDTIRMGPHVRRLDFAYGRGTIRLRFPEELLGERVWLSLGSYSSVGARSDQTGWASFSIPLQKPGDYPIGLQLPGTYRSIYLPGTYDPEEAEQFTIPGDQPFLQEIDLRGCAIVTGSVRGSWQEFGISPPQVWAYAASDSSAVGIARVEADGSFRLVILDAQPVMLASRMSGTELWFGGGDHQTGTTFDLGAGSRLSDVLLLESGIRCVLEGAGTSSSLEARILVRNEEEQIWWVSGYGPKLTLSNLRAGRYYVRVDGWCSYRPPDWADQWYDGASSMAQASPVDLTEGQGTTITFRLTQGGRIAGRLLAADGSGLDLARFKLYDEVREPLCDSWLYADSAAFAFTGLSDGDYYLACRMSYDSTWWYPGTASPDSAGAISIQDHASITGLSWRLPQAGTMEQR